MSSIEIDMKTICAQIVCETKQIESKLCFLSLLSVKEDLCVSLRKNLCTSDLLQTRLSVNYLYWKVYFLVFAILRRIQRNSFTPIIFLFLGSERNRCDDDARLNRGKTKTNEQSIEIGIVDRHMRAEMHSAPSLKKKWMKKSDQYEKLFWRNIFFIKR